MREIQYKKLTRLLMVNRREIQPEWSYLLKGGETLTDAEMQEIAKNRRGLLVRLLLVLRFSGVIKMSMWDGELISIEQGPSLEHPNIVKLKLMRQNAFVRWKCNCGVYRTNEYLNYRFGLSTGQPSMVPF